MAGVATAIAATARAAAVYALAVVAAAAAFALATESPVGPPHTAPHCAVVVAAAAAIAPAHAGVAVATARAVCCQGELSPAATSPFRILRTRPYITVLATCNGWDSLIRNFNTPRLLCFQKAKTRH